MNTLHLRRRRDSGFSLVELVIALVLIGVLAGLAAPSLNGWINRSRLEAAASELSADLAQVRMLAVRSGEGATLRLVSATEYEVVLPNGTVRRTDLAAEHPRVAVSASVTNFEFNSRGFLRSASAAGPITVTQDGRTVVVHLLSSGRAFVEF